MTLIGRKIVASWRAPGRLGSFDRIAPRKPRFHWPSQTSSLFASFYKLPKNIQESERKLSSVRSVMDLHAGLKARIDIKHYD